MKVNARTEKFQHIEVFDKPALFTNGRIARDTAVSYTHLEPITADYMDLGEMSVTFELYVKEGKSGGWQRAADYFTQENLSLIHI